MSDAMGSRWQPWGRFRGKGLSVGELAHYGLYLMRHPRSQRLSTSGLISHAIHRGKDFETRHWRPKARSLPEKFHQQCDTADATIVLQGPIEHQSLFTLETVRHYRLSYPASTLVVSTWEDQPADAVAALEDAGATVVTSRDPENPGPSNFNRQVISAQAGITVARELGSKFVWKTRTDQRVYSPLALPLMRSLLDLFPVVRSDLKAQGRLIVPSLNTFSDRVYGATDQMQFGHLEDIERLWETELDPRPASLVTDNSGASWVDLDVCETRLNSRYLAASGWPLRRTYEDSLAALAALYCVIDASGIDLFWPKYAAREYRWRNYGDSEILSEISFAEWLLLWKQDSPS